MAIWIVFAVMGAAAVMAVLWPLSRRPAVEARGDPETQFYREQLAEIELPDRLPVGTPVTLIGDGVRAEHHAEVAGTINYELVSRIDSRPARARRSVLDA